MCIRDRYRITFFGNTVSLKDTLGEDKLGSLSSLNTIELVYDSSSIKSSLQASPSSNDVIVPLITHTKRLIYDSNVSSTTAENVAYNSNVTGVYWNDLKYALRVDKIVQAISSTYGINFSDDFFTSTNEPYYNLFMWLHRKKGDVTSTGTGNILAQSLVNTWTVTHNPQQTGIINVSTLNITSITLNPSPNSNFQFGGLTLKLRTTSTDLYNVSIQINGQEVHRAVDVSGDVDISDTEYNLVAGGYNVITVSYTHLTLPTSDLV